MKYRATFEPMKIGNVVVKNRVVMGPMGHGQADDACAYSKAAEDFMVYRARGGVGLIISGCTDPDFEIDNTAADSVGVLVNPNYSPKAFIERGTELTERVHSYGTKIFIQITVGLGRAFYKKSASNGSLWPDVDQHSIPMTKKEIQRKVELVANAACIAKKAGFDGVDIHALHEASLLEEFALSYFNHRTDEYGGCLENRLRFTKEVIEAIQQACGKNFPITMRVAAKEYLKAAGKALLDGEENREVGRDISETIKIVKYLESWGVAAVLVDSGMIDSMYRMYQPMYISMGANLQFTSEIKKNTSIPVICTGRMHEPELIENSILSGKADGVCMARALLADPDFVKKMQIGDERQIRPCLSCNVGCLHRLFSGQRYSCAVNPQVNRETTYGISKTLQNKRVLIIGGGVAGLEAARILALRGHKPEIWEKSGELGGHLLSGGVPDFKQEEGKLLAWYIGELNRLHVPVYFHQDATADMVRLAHADAVICATGSEPVIPHFVKGSTYAITGVNALRHTDAVGKSVVIVGGGLVGTELALYLEQEGRQVTIIEMLPQLLASGKTVPIMNRMYLIDAIRLSGIKVCLNCKLLRVEKDGAVVDYEGKEQKILADTVVVAAGFKERNSLYDELKSEMDVYNIGDSRTVSNIKNAIWDAYEVARSL